MVNQSIKQKGTNLNENKIFNNDRFCRIPINGVAYWIRDVLSLYYGMGPIWAARTKSNSNNVYNSISCNNFDNGIRHSRYELLQ